VHDDLDDLIGILFVNDIFRTNRPGHAPAAAKSPGMPPIQSPRDLPQGASALPPAETLGVMEALADMRKHRRAVAVVVDEYGGVAGLLTVKDLLEPLVGDLHDEFDEVEEAHIVRVDNTRWLIDGQTNVDDVRERIGIDIPTASTSPWADSSSSASVTSPARGVGPGGGLGHAGGGDGQAAGGAGRGDLRRRRARAHSTRG